MDNTFSEKLRSALEPLKIGLTEQQVETFYRFYEDLVEKNKVMNLTAITEFEDVLCKHFVDSLSIVRKMNLKNIHNMVDIGTGAGFPGIPFGIMTGREGTLLDSVGKKVQAVQEFVDALGLGERLEAVPMRVEELAAKRKGQYACVTARAVAELNVLLEYAAPLLRKDGLLVVSKGRLSDGELKNGAYAAKVCGFEIVSRETSELPHEAGHREMLIYRKVRKPEIKLPRNVGMAKHKPLMNS